MSFILTRHPALCRSLKSPPRSRLHTCATFCIPSKTKSDGLSVVPSIHNVDTVVGQTIPEFLFSNLHKWEKANAFECGVSGRKYTHLDVYKQSQSFAGALQQHGLKSGDVVAVLLPNVPEYASIILGILNAGLIASPFNPTYTAHEIATQINTCQAKSVVTIAQFLPQVKEAKTQCSSLKSIILVGDAVEDCHSYFTMVKAVDPASVKVVKGKDVKSDDVAILPWSSGTTGNPKGVMLTHSNVNTNLFQITYPGYLFTQPFEGGYEQDKFIGILPFFHIYGFVLIMAKTLYQGSYTMTLPKFEPPTFIQSLRKHKPSFLHLVPPLIAFMGAVPDITREDMKCVKGVMAGAAPVGPAIIQKILEKGSENFLFQEGYGMTELSPVSHITPVEARNKKIGSCGVPIPSTTCKVINPETGEALGPNQRGELCVKGPQVMKGYYKNEKATAETIDADGWLHTGDICIYDEDKYFSIVDRLKELIKVKGLQVAPSELEDLLRTHPGVADVAVIGIPDERAGELPRAYIVPKSKTVTEKDIHGFVDSKVSPHKKLKGGIEFLQAIPKAASGKILRKDLKKRYTEQRGK